jgi:hypothetical protein
MPAAQILKSPTHWVTQELAALRRLFHQPTQSPRLADAGPGSMTRYKFQAIVKLLPAAREALPPGQLPTHAVIRAADHHGPSGGQYTGLVLSWEPSPVVSDDEAIAVVVAYGPDPAACLPIGGTFALWRGTDLAVGTVTRKVFV